jgi:hypothetical protein
MSVAQELAEKLRAIIAREEPRLRAIAPDAAHRPPRPGKWSPAEVIGHLIDSASNNHQRFVRTQLQDAYESQGYAQEAWVKTQGYAEEPWADLIELWAAANRHLAHVVARMPAAALTHACTIVSPDGKANPAMSLEALVTDYLRHLEHHMAQIGAADAATRGG